MTDSVARTADTTAEMDTRNSDPAVPSSRAIIDVNNALKDALARYVHSGIGVMFDLPDTDSLPATPTLSVFLYEVHEDLRMRTAQPRVISRDPRTHAVTVHPASVNINCNYLITYWNAQAAPEAGSPAASAGNDAMTVMNQVVNALINNRQLEALPGAYVRMISPKDELDSLGNFWQSLGNKPRLSLHASVTVPVLLTMRNESRSVPTVTVVEPRVTQIGESSLANELIHFFSFDVDLADELRPAVLLQPFDPNSPGTAVQVADNFGGNALRVSTVESGPGVLNGLKLADDVSTHAQFSIGFWFRSDKERHDVPVISNKRAIGIFFPGFEILHGPLNGLNQLKFSLGDEKSTVAKTLEFTLGAWVYVAMTVDTVGHTMTAYVGDPSHGFQSDTQNIGHLDVSKLSGLDACIGLNETARGNSTTGSNVHGSFIYNDLAMWRRVLTEDEVRSLFASKRPLSAA